jgi:hypothetical protein
VARASASETAALTGIASRITVMTRRILLDWMRRTRFNAPTDETDECPARIA